jgi:hypothetical protein
MRDSLKNPAKLKTPKLLDSACSNLEIHNQLPVAVVSQSARVVQMVDQPTLTAFERQRLG